MEESFLSLPGALQNLTALQRNADTCVVGTKDGMTSDVALLVVTFAKEMVSQLSSCFVRNC